MKNKILLLFLLLIIPIKTHAGDPFYKPILNTSSTFYDDEQSWGKIIEVENFKLENNVLNMQGRAYLKGWSNILVQSDFKYQYKNGSIISGKYNPNVLYWFRFYDEKNPDNPIELETKLASSDWTHPYWNVMKNGDVVGKIRYVDSYDLFRLFAPITRGTSAYDENYGGNITGAYYKTGGGLGAWSTFSAVGAILDDKYTTHYRGSFKIENLQLDKILTQKGNYKLQIKIQVRGKAGGPSVKNCFGQDGKEQSDKSCYGWDVLDFCGENADSWCDEWSDIYGLFDKTAENRAKDKKLNNKVALSDYEKFNIGRGLAGSGYPILPDDKDSCANSGGGKIAKNTKGITVTNYNTNFYVSRRIPYPGITVKLPNSIKCFGNRDTVRIPKFWIQTSGTLTFTVDNDIIKNKKKYYNAPKSCEDGEYLIEKDRIFLSYIIKNYDNELCRTKVPSGTINFPALYKKYCINNESAPNDRINSICDTIRKKYDLGNVIIRLGNVNTISDYGTEAKFWYDSVKKLATNSFLLGNDGDSKLFTSFETENLHEEANQNEQIISYIMKYNDSEKTLNNLVNEDFNNYNYRLAGLDPDSSKPSEWGFNSSVTGSSDLINLNVSRKFKINDDGDVKADVRIMDSESDDIDLCKDGNLNPAAFADGKDLLQWAIVDVNFCAPTKIPINPVCKDYEPKKPICKANEEIPGQFHETKQSYIESVCEEKNFDDTSKDTSKIKNGFNLVESPYCNVVCMDDVDLLFPGQKASYAGSSFNLDVYSPNTTKRPSISMKRSCYTKIDGNKFWNDYNNKPDDQDKIIGNLNKCLSFNPSLYTGDIKSPKVTFNYDDPLKEKLKEELKATQYPNYSTDKTVMAEDISVSKVDSVDSEQLDSQISSTESNIDNNSNYGKESKIVDNIITKSSCDELGCTYKVGDKTFKITDHDYYIKKTQTKTWNYSMEAYYAKIPTGEIESEQPQLSDKYYKIEGNKVPVSLTAIENLSIDSDTWYNYYLKVSDIEDDTRKHSDENTSLEDAINEKIFNSSTMGYNCKYKVVDDITTDGGGGDDPSPKLPNYFYRTIDVSNINPNIATKRYGYNWHGDYLNNDIVRSLIEKTENFQVLIGASTRTIDSNDRILNNPDKYKIMENAEHFSFTLTPATMNKIKRYNNDHSYSDISTLSCSSDSHYCTSSLLTCLGTNGSNPACNNLNLENIENSTRDTNLLEHSRNLLRQKNIALEGNDDE